MASGVVISLTALTGGITPAIADPKNEPVVPTTTVAVPEPEVVVPEETKRAEAEAPKPEAPPSAPVTVPAPASVESPPQTQIQTQTETPAQAPQTVAPTTAPVITSVAPASPTTAVKPPETTAKAPAPRVVEPATTGPATTGPATTGPSSTEPAPVTSTEQKAASSAPATPPAPLTTSASTAPASPALVAPTSETTSASAATETESKTSTEGEEPSSSSASSSVATSSKTSSSTVSQAAQVIEQSEPQTLQAPEKDLEIAKTAKVVEVKPEPAPKQDVDALSSELNLNLGLGLPGGINASASADSEVRLASARVWDRDVRQWSPDWVQYDEYYRPVLLNPFRDAVRIVYVYQNAPRIVWIPPLARIVLEVAQFAAYSFTAVVATAANLVNAAVNTAVNVAVGSFFGGGYFPGIGMPLPPPPPPVLRYDNVPVLVRYTDRVYEPFRVRRIVDVGDDARFGERKVLLDGATPAWGVWKQTPSGERQFEVHRTQQFPGLDNPQEAPLPGDYQLRLASDETSSSGFTGRDIFLFVAAGVIGTLGFGAIGLAFWLGRRRPQH
ncbi:MAG TPA: hypothetical protein VJ777_18690 [Mycobacterium sp.]|nr:hypothetical protein [Mycobacterium sp.]